MVTRFKIATNIFASALIALICTSNAVLAQSSNNYEPERSWDGSPDLNGIWQAIGTAHWDLQDHEASAGLPEMGAIGAIPPGQGVVVGGEIPYQEWALEQKQENWANRPGADPETKCYLPGVPRATYLPYPFQILQGTGKIMIVYGYAEANRTIHMDKETPEAAPLDTWMGRSHGRWEGNTLVVDAQDFNGEAWFDRAARAAPDRQNKQSHNQPHRFGPRPDQAWAQWSNLPASGFLYQAGRQQVSNSGSEYQNHAVD